MIVIKSGPQFNKIYADKAFDQWGTPSNEDIRIVDEWTDINIPDDAERYDSQPHSHFAEFIVKSIVESWS